jgi:hypothetical protein
MINKVKPPIIISELVFLNDITSPSIAIAEMAIEKYINLYRKLIIPFELSRPVVSMFSVSTILNAKKK